MQRLALTLVAVLFLAGCATPPADSDPTTPGPAPASLEPPHLIAPEAFQALLVPIVEFEWRFEFPPAATFTVLMGETGESLTPVPECADVDARHCSAIGFQPGQSYFWRVDALLPSGDTISSDVQPFSIVGSLEYAQTIGRGDSPVYGAPLLEEPPNGAAGITPEATFRWRPVADADRYEVRAATGNGTLLLCTTTSTSCSAPALPAGEVFTWWVDVFRDGKIAVVSTARTAVAYTAPPPLQLLRPLIGGSVHGASASFEWLPSDAYQNQDVVVYASTGEDFSKVCSTTGTTCSADFGHLKEVQWYAETTDGKSIVRTPTVSFRTGGPPLVPIPEYPADDSTVPRNTTMTWRALGDPTGEAVRYQVEIGVGGTWEKWCEVARGSCPLDFPSGITEAEWRVRAIDQSGLESLSELRTVRFELESPALIIREPRDGAAHLYRVTNVSWDDLTAPVAVDTPPIYYVDLRDGSGAWNTVCETPHLTCEVTLPPAAAVELRVREGHRGAVPVAGAEQLPVVFLHGWTGEKGTWSDLAAQLQREGVPTLKVEYEPLNQQERLPALAARVQLAIDAELSQAGFPQGQRFHIVAHSMGGLIARILVEQEGAGTAWDQTGWRRDAGPRLADGYSDRVASLTTVGTPHNGPIDSAGICKKIGSFFGDVWEGATCDDMQPHGSVLRALGLARHDTIPYVLVSGYGDWDFSSAVGYMIRTAVCGGPHDGIVCEASARHGYGHVVQVPACHSSSGLAQLALCTGPSLLDYDRTWNVVRQQIAA